MKISSASIALSIAFFSVKSADALASDGNEESLIAAELSISYDLLSQQGVSTNEAINRFFSNSTLFEDYSATQSRLVTARDEADTANLQEGIDYSVEQGVLDEISEPVPYTKIDVLSLVPADTASIILLASNLDDSTVPTDEGSSIIVIGKSGTGKGATLSELEKMLIQLGQDEDKIINWSAGNVFRSYTLLAVTWWEQQQEDGNIPLDCDFNAGVAITPSNMELFTSMLQFGLFNNEYDTRIRGLGFDTYVSEIKFTELASNKVTSVISSVANLIQGEAILFIKDALEILKEDAFVVLLDGREPSMNYVPTPNRFELILSDPNVIGNRRAAQLVGAAALESVNEDASDEEVAAALNEALETLASSVVEEVVGGSTNNEQRCVVAGTANVQPESSAVRQDSMIMSVTFTGLIGLIWFGM